MNKTLKKVLLLPFNVLYKINAKVTFKIIYFLKHRTLMNLDSPKTYTEKLNWMKLYYRNKLMPVCADKYRVREYVIDQGCEEILTNLLWHGEYANDIPFDKLPKQFVIKVTHGSGSNIICRDKDKLNRDKTVNTLNKWLKEKYLPAYGEWFYGIITPRIIIEEFLSEDEESIPVDYKMFCFNNFKGKHDVAVTAIDTERFTDHKRKVYDEDWNLLEGAQINFTYDNNNSFDKPKHYDKMVEYAKKLSQPFPHARVDFYVVSDKIYFGEITFISDAGFGKITPNSLNIKMGSWMELPEINK